MSLFDVKEGVFEPNKVMETKKGYKEKMPYKHINYKLKSENDRRIKLTKEERQEIRDNYGKISQRKLASAYCVSRRLIQFIGDPEKHKHNLLMRAIRGGSKIYYKKSKHTIAMKKHRRYKQYLYLLGELEGQNGK